MEINAVSSNILIASQRIEKATRNIYKLAKDKANAEYEYRQALGEEIARLKADGTSVSIIGDMARGNVAELKLKRDMADVMYKSAIESLRAIQSELSALQSVGRWQSEVGG